jgi:hypothetical protein
VEIVEQSVKGLPVGVMVFPVTEIEEEKPHNRRMNCRDCGAFSQPSGLPQFFCRKYASTA